MFFPGKLYIAMATTYPNICINSLISSWIKRRTGNRIPNQKNSNIITYKLFLRKTLPYEIQKVNRKIFEA